MIVVKHVNSIFGSLLPIRLSTFKLVFRKLNQFLNFYFLNMDISLNIYTPVMIFKDVLLILPLREACLKILI